MISRIGVQNGGSRHETAATEFEVLLPGVQQLAERAFRGYLASEREDLVAEAIANAFCTYR